MALNGVPIVHAGDVFDRWDTPVEFVNLMIDYWPSADFFAVPGQHDLPGHSYAEIDRSAYWNLVKAGRITTLDPGKLQCIGDGLYVRGFPWGFPIEPLPAAKRDGYCYLLVAHRYVYDRENPSQAGDEAHTSVIRGHLQGYDASLFGDHHRQFVTRRLGKQPIFNHGTALRRHADERDLQVGPGVLYDDGSIERVELAMPPEVWADAPAQQLAAPLGVDADALLKLLRAGGEAAVSFRDAVDRAKREATPPLTPAELTILEGWVK